MKKVYVILISSLLIGLVGGLYVVGSLAAETYDVNAVVPYAAPTQAAVIQNPTPGVAVSNALQQVGGTCENIAPPSVVSIWRNGQILGSTNCTSGSFQLNVILVPGQNSLIARTANANGIFGPDSVALSITYNEPVVTVPLPINVSIPTNQAQQENASNAGSKAGLSLTTVEPFSVIESSNASVTIRVIVAGGENPYDLTLNWGDGSTETKKIDAAGTYEFTHVYHTQQGYSVYVRVRDVKGAYTEYIYAVVSTKSGGVQQQSKGGKTYQNQPMASAGNWVWYSVIVGIVLLVLVAVTTYRIGYRRAQKRYEQGVKSAKRVIAIGKRSRKREE